MINKKDAITLMFAGILFAVCIKLAVEHDYWYSVLCFVCCIVVGGIGMKLIGPKEGVSKRGAADSDEAREYTSTMLVRARPMKYAEYAALRKWMPEEGSYGEADGYFVEFIDKKYVKLYDSAHQSSWIEKDKFEHVYTLRDETDMGNMSDGYHTFNELYEHRMALFSAIVSAYPERSWKSRKHFDDENDPMFDGYFVVGVETPAGEATYHYKLEVWDMFNCKEVPRAPKWDGHSPSDVVQRLLTLRTTA